jgi:hydroxyethylthiazole kinase-like uncharacterized protein yjeF
MHRVTDPPLLTVAAIRALEARALSARPEGALMDRAAQAVAEAVAERLRRMPAGTPVLALAGPGNNGADALLAALDLARRGWAVEGLALSPVSPITAEGARAWQRWRDGGRSLAHPEALDALLVRRPIVIDGLFGIGLARPLPFAASSVAARLAAAGSVVVAVDVPSGLDADRGAVVGGPGAVAIRAEVTVTMIADKPGLHTGAGPAHAGEVRVASLGIVPGDDAEPGAGSVATPRARGALIDRDAARRRVVPRTRDAHKGCFGDVLIVAGEPAMRGASLLAALGAQAAGAGRIFVGLADAHPLEARPPELMTRRLHPAAERPEAALGTAQAIVAGCGLGHGAAANAILVPALAHPAALVLDADGLNRIAEAPALRARLAARGDLGYATVLTPHPLEAARLLGTSTAAVQADRLGSACALAAATGAYVVLKGAGTVVAEPDGCWTINATGGPILAVAGTGDVLAGTVGGLLATGLPAPDAARLGAWLHGAAGDRLAARSDWAASCGLPASRLPAAIAATLNRLAGNRCAA